MAFVAKRHAMHYEGFMVPGSGTTRTHLVVPGMVVTKVNGRPLTAISFNQTAVVKYLNDYRLADAGPLRLHFQEATDCDGVVLGFPRVLEVSRQSTTMHAAHANRGRRASVAGKLGLVKSLEQDASIKTARMEYLSRAGGPQRTSSAAALAASSAAGSAVKYKVLATATVRAGPDGSSDKVCEFKEGTMIECIEHGMQVINAQAMVVIQCVSPPPGGWLKVQTSRGKTLLQRVTDQEGDSPSYGRPATLPESAVHEADSLKPVKYTVLSAATVREGPDNQSGKVGEVAAGTVIDCLEHGFALKNSDGIVVVQCMTPPAGALRGGWLKTQTSKGKVLLERADQNTVLGSLLPESVHGANSLEPVKYVVMSRSTVRSAPSNASVKVGEFKAGTVIDCIEHDFETVNDSGGVVVQSVSQPAGSPRGGWLKLKTSKGKNLLERLPDDTLSGECSLSHTRHAEVISLLVVLLPLLLLDPAPPPPPLSCQFDCLQASPTRSASRRWVTVSPVRSLHWRSNRLCWC